MENLDLTHSRWANSAYRVSSSNHQQLEASTSSPSLPQWISQSQTQQQPRSTHAHAQPNPSPNSPPHSTPLPPPNPIRHQAHPPSLPLYNRLLRRLKWKSHFLLLSYTLALTHQITLPIGPSTYSITIPSPSSSSPTTTSKHPHPNPAETMFKADFFEFYALLERALVTLLSCLGVIVTANRDVPPIPEPDSTGPPKDTILGDSRAFRGGGGVHRFHANVLSALDNPGNPLHGVLGTGKVRGYLGLSKEFRNRWKEVEREGDGGTDDLEGLHGSYRKILEELELGSMLAGILEGLEGGGKVVAGYLVGRRDEDGNGGLDVEMGGGGGEEGEGDEDEVLIGVDDAMDWD